jgi:hypothetical protein
LSFQELALEVVTWIARGCGVIAGLLFFRLANSGPIADLQETPATRLIAGAFIGLFSGVAVYVLISGGFHLLMLIASIVSRL